MVNCKEINYFLPGPNPENDKRVSTEITKQLQKYFKDLFKGIGCSDGKFSLQVTLDSKQYLVSPRCVAGALQKPFKEELEQLQQKDIKTLLGTDDTAQW